MMRRSACILIVTGIGTGMYAYLPTSDFFQLDVFFQQQKWILLPHYDYN